MKLVDYESPPYLNSAQMREVDRIMVDEYKIELIQMMENAGRNLAHLTRERVFGGELVGKRIAVLAGPGGNGGGALAAARRLYGWGARVSVFLTRPIADLAPVTRQQLQSLQRLAVTGQDGVTKVPLPKDSFDAVLDGLMGYGLRGAPRETTVELIEWANRQSAPVIALDIPSGIDASSGIVHDPAIWAFATLALALPKLGMTSPQARERVGELYVADIGVPSQLYARPAFDFQLGPLFAHGDIVRLW